jgi:hypothetical protein
LALLLILKDGNKKLTKDLIDSYGVLSYKDVKCHSETYVNLENRSAQDSVMLYLCIMASLTEAGQKKVRSLCEYKSYGHSSHNKALFTRQDPKRHGFRH